MNRTLFFVVFVWSCFARAMLGADQTIQSAQRALKDQGFYYGAVTGNADTDTSAAIRRFQIRRGLKITGELNPETLQALRIAAGSATASSAPVAPPPAKATTNGPRSTYETRPAASPPTGANRRSATAEATRAPRFETRPPLNQPSPQLPPGDGAQRRLVAGTQEHLARRGYYRGNVDGTYGPGTAATVRSFQARAGIPPTGRVDPQTLVALAQDQRNDGRELAPRESRYSKWFRGEKRSKHGKEKGKNKKHLRGYFDDDEDDDEHGDENDRRSRGAHERREHEEREEREDDD